jgi:hypothetical protein
MIVMYKVYTIFMIIINVKQHVIKFYSLSAICEMIVYKMWEPRRHTTLQVSTTCYMDSILLLK